MNQFSEIRALPGSIRKTFSGGFIGYPNPTERIYVTLHLKSKRHFEERTRKGRFLPREDLLHTCPEDFRPLGVLADYFSAFDIKLSDIYSHMRLVRITGTIAAMEAAFHVKLANFVSEGKIFRTRAGAICLPEELQEIVSGIFGLDNRLQAFSHLRLADNTQSSFAKPNAFDAVQLAKIYDFPDGDGSGQTIGIIELGGGFLQSDIEAFFRTLNLPIPEVKAVSVLSGSNQPNKDSGADTEVALDIQVAGAAAPAAKIVVYFAPNTEEGFLQAIVTAIHDVDNKPSILSISWGAAESAWTEQAMLAMDDAFRTAASIGMSVFAAAGDDGVNDNVNNLKAHVDFPASSPCLTACGGTNLKIQNGQRIEVAWHSEFHGATGGGISNVFDRPPYQQHLNMPSNRGSQKDGRGLPDVSAVADPATGYAVLVNGSWLTVGGTSAVSPLYSGLTARINQRLGRSSGLINPSLYSALGTPGFNDVVQGSNSSMWVHGYQAVVGWDPVTGWGTPGGTALLNLLSFQPPG